MNLWQLIRKRVSNRDLQGYIDLINQAAGNYALTGNSTTFGEKQEDIPGTFEGYTAMLMKANPVVWGCMLIRMSVFAEARFKYRRVVAGMPGELFSAPGLAILEEPWPNGTTGDLLARMIQDVDLCGNFFGVALSRKRMARLRPDWTTIVLGSKSDPKAGFGKADVEPLGYIYHPGGRGSGAPSEPFLIENVAHWAPYPDPVAAFRGMSWITPAVRDVMGDQAATTHKLNYLEQGAVPNMVVTVDASVTREEFEKWVELFEEEHGGLENAYKTVFLGAGSSVDVVGNDLRKVDFKNVQALGENRISVAAGTPGILVGLSEGLQAATLANYAQARRRFSDGTVRFLWRTAAGSLAKLVPKRGGAELWYDARDISFLQEDAKDGADILRAQAVTLELLVKAGYTPESAKQAVAANDMGRLVHSGLVSVQLQKPGANEGKGGSSNGKPKEAPVVPENKD